MKREIKLRSWDNECKVIREYDELKGLTLDALDASDFELEQYTGLKDKNGREIYEGDIVRVQETMDGGRIVCLEAIASVVWNDERGCWGCKGGFEGHLADYAFITVFSFMGNTSEVIGNIYENPELLEAEEMKNDVKL